MIISQITCFWLQSCTSCPHQLSCCCCCCCCCCWLPSCRASTALAHSFLCFYSSNNLTLVPGLGGLRQHSPQEDFHIQLRWFCPCSCSCLIMFLDSNCCSYFYQALFLLQCHIQPRIFFGTWWFHLFLGVPSNFGKFQSFLGNFSHFGIFQLFLGISIILGLFSHFWGRFDQQHMLWYLVIEAVPTLVPISGPELITPSVSLDCHNGKVI